MNPKKKVTSVSEETAMKYRKAEAKRNAARIKAKDAIHYWEEDCPNGAEKVARAFMDLNLAEHEFYRAAARVAAEAINPERFVNIDEGQIFDRYDGPELKA